MSTHTEKLEQENAALRAALQAAVHYVDAWHAASNVNIQNPNSAVTQILYDVADAKFKEGPKCLSSK